MDWGVGGVSARGHRYVATRGCSSLFRLPFSSPWSGTLYWAHPPALERLDIGKIPATEDIGEARNRQNAHDFSSHSLHFDRSQLDFPTRAYDAQAQANLSQINEQIVLYVLSRVVLSFVPRLYSPPAPPTYPFSPLSHPLPPVTALEANPKPIPPAQIPFAVVAAASWAGVMYMFRHRGERIQPGMGNSMREFAIFTFVYSAFALAAPCLSAHALGLALPPVTQRWTARSRVR